MSDRPIQVGDMVMVVRGVTCCGSLTGSEGKIFAVTSIFTDTKGYICDFCEAKNEQYAARGLPGTPRAIDLDRLKRIPPLSELEETKETAEA